MCVCVCVCVCVFEFSSDTSFGFKLINLPLSLSFCVIQGFGYSLEFSVEFSSRLISFRSTNAPASIALNVWFRDSSEFSLGFCSGLTWSPKASASIAHCWKRLSGTRPTLFSLGFSLRL